MFVKVVDGVVDVFPYGPDVLRRENPQTSFPDVLSNETLADWGVFPVTPMEIPDGFDNVNQNATTVNPELIDGVWYQKWLIEPASSEEVVQRIADLAQNAKANRAAAYATESDPLFFKAQRGKATHQEWLDKIAEIEARFPYPEV
jgi:hypothetical protein